MIIDSLQYNGICSCGREHKMQTEFCIVENGCLKEIDKYLDKYGLKGYTVGGVQVSEKHAGFVINIGGATAADLLQLVADVQEKVYQMYQVRLEPEVKMIGEF